MAPRTQQATHAKTDLSPEVKDMFRPVRHKAIKWWQFHFLQNIRATWSRMNAFRT